MEHFLFDSTVFSLKPNNTTQKKKKGKTATFVVVLPLEMLAQSAGCLCVEYIKISAFKFDIECDIARLAIAEAAKQISYVALSGR